MRIRRKELLIFAGPLVLALSAAYAEWAIVGLPALPPLDMALAAAAPPGFPPGLRITHYVNLLFMILLVRSGLQILMDHPRLYWNFVGL